MNKPQLAIFTDQTENTFVSLVERWKIPFQIISQKNTQTDISQFMAVAILAGQYPDLPENIGVLQEYVRKAQELTIPTYVEGIPIPTLISPNFLTKEYARLVARTSNHPILEGFKELDLLETHQNPFLIMEKDASYNFPYEELLSFGKVAGVYKADYGLPNETFLGLGIFGKMIFATIKLSEFDRMEFRLKIRFGQLMMNISKYLTSGWWTIDPIDFQNPFDNRQYLEEIKGLNKAERRQKYIETVTFGLEWFEKADMLVEPSGIGGVYEGYTSAFEQEGKKFYRFDDDLGYRYQRADCTADTAISFFLASRFSPEGKMTQELQKKYEIIGNNLFDELYDYWQHYPDNQSIMRGFFGWSNSPYDMGVAYSDDNGRVTFESLLYSYILKNERKFRNSFAAVNALRSTVGKNGHRWSRIDLKDFYKKKGRKWFSKENVSQSKYRSPHYDAWTFVAILYGAYLIQDQEMIDLIENGVEDYMKRFPDLPLEHSIGDDFSKLLIACVMLYQCTKRETHLDYVRKIVDFFAQYQDEQSGAFPEIDPLNKHARTENSNKRYGSGEAALYTDPADTISDQLYSLGFLALGLYCASKTDKCPNATSMLEKLLDYLCVIQLRSSNQQLNGAWTRGFDFRYGEPYGANGDVGWGAYSIETGWTIGPILTSFTLYLLDLDIFEPLDAEFAQKIKSEYMKEKQIQEGLEKTWKKHTPKRIKHQTKMPRKELDKILKEFKCNSKNIKR